MAVGWMELLVLLLSGGGGGDLLDYLPTDAYWRAKGVTVSVERMVNELAADAPADVAKLVGDLGAEDFKTREAAMQKLRALGPAAAPALQRAAENDDPEVRTRAQELLKAAAGGGAQAKAVRRLMAVRTLGELKKPEALAALRPLLDSKALFEADYARAAVAAIEGKPFERPRPAAAALWKDFCLLPARCGIAGQAAMPPGGPVAFDKVLKDAAAALPPGQDAAALLDQLTQIILAVAERVGNVRLQAITIGVSEDAGNGKGFAVVAALGLYDAAAARAALAQLGLAAAKVDGVDVLAAANEARLIPCSNERFVAVVGPSEEHLPLAAVAAAIGKDGAEPALDPKMLELVKSVERSGPAWAVARMTDAYRQAPLLAPFDTLTLATREQPGGVVALTLVAVGKDAAAVKAAADEMDKGVKSAAAEVKREMARMAALKPVSEFLDSVKLTAEGSRLTSTATLKGTSAILMLPMMLFTARAAPAQPAPVPQKRDADF